MDSKSSFRLLAIRPRKNCDATLLKNLRPDQVYKFYNAVKFYDKAGNVVKKTGEIVKAEIKSNIPEDFYDQKSADGYPIKISISAVVGKNGSGKSSLVDLFLASIFVFSDHYGLLRPSVAQLPSVIENLSRLKNSIDDSKFSDAVRSIQRETSLGWPSNKEKILQVIGKFRAMIDRIGELENQIRRENLLLRDSNLLKNGLRVEIYYQVGDAVYKLKIGDGAPSVVLLTSGSGKALNPSELLKKFFYSIVTNYSLYGLNSSQMGEWLDSLFHKNDGYRTPVVINPMRDEGRFNVNKEILFAKYRLLSNKIIEWKSLGVANMTDKQTIHRIRFTLNDEKTEGANVTTSQGSLTGNPREANLLNELLELYFPGYLKPEILDDHSLTGKVCRYIVRKVDLIGERYPEYEDGFVGSEESRLSDLDFLTKIKNDNSHIAFKINQAINFLMHQQKWSNYFPDGADTFELSFEELFEWMEHPDLTDIIRHIPPPIFNIEFILSDNSGQRSLFHNLSSGEQQLIHTTQSVVYHINNIQSIHRNEIDRRSRYKFINIIFDEVELYFHPEYQRKLVNSILQAISRMYLGRADGIQGINILFLTHSPFILSDLFSECVLKISLNGKDKAVPVEEKNQTFAANIHEMLANSFFLENALMGEFARKKIYEIITSDKKGRELIKLIWRLLSPVEYHEL